MTKRARKKPLLTEEQARQLWRELPSRIPTEHAVALDQLAQIMAAKNVSGTVSPRRVWRELGLRYLLYRERYDYLSDQAWSAGFRAATSRSVSSMKYVRKAAESAAERQASRSRWASTKSGAEHGPPPMRTT